MIGDFPEYHTMPVYEQYSDNEDWQEVMADDPPEELEPTPEVGDTYVNTGLMLPCASTLFKGRVTGHNRDAGGQVSGWANNKPILGTKT